MANVINPYRFASAAPIQHLRIYPLGAHLVEVGIAQIMLATSTGGANILTGSMGSSASSTRSGGTNDLLTGLGHWAPTNLLGSWVQFDLLAPYRLAELKIVARSAGFFHQAPTAFMIATSASSGGPWSPRQIFSSHGAFTSNGETKTFALDLSSALPNTRSQARIWIIDVTDTNHTDGRVGLYEFGLRDVASGANVISNLVNGAVVSEPSYFAIDANDKISHLCDGNNSTYFRTDPARSGFELAKIGFCFNAPRAPVELTLNEPGVLAPKDFTIRWSSDGLNFTTTDTITGQTGWTASTRVFAIT